MSKKYTEAIMADGACILEDGKPITIDEILIKLNDYEKIKNEYNNCEVISGQKT